MFLKECKYIVKENKMTKYITDPIEISSNSDAEDSDEENSNNEISDEGNFGEENWNANWIQEKLF